MPVNLAVEEPGILDSKYNSPQADDSGEANNCNKFFKAPLGAFSFAFVPQKLGKPFAKLKAYKMYNMKLKHIAAGTAFLFGSLFSHAQSGQIRAGLNLANVSVTSNGRVNDANQLTTFQVGVIGDFKLGTSFLSLQPGLLYTGKGSKIQNGTAGQSGYYKQTFNPMYLELPVNLVFKAPIGGASRLFVGAGPYVAMGISGKVKTEGKNVLGQNYNREQNIEFSNDDPTTFNTEEGAGLGLVRRFDYGLNGTAGIEGKSMVLGVNYGLGLAKLQSGTNSGADNNNKFRTLSITLGFKF